MQRGHQSCINRIRLPRICIRRQWNVLLLLVASTAESCNTQLSTNIIGMDLDFEFILEGFALGLDGIILGFLFKSYESCSAYVEALKVMMWS